MAGGCVEACASCGPGTTAVCELTLMAGPFILVQKFLLSRKLYGTQRDQSGHTSRIDLKKSLGTAARNPCSTRVQGDA
jgi:hypothetical protein